LGLRVVGRYFIEAQVGERVGIVLGLLVFRL
jgi:hypothetical protein